MRNFFLALLIFCFALSGMAQEATPELTPEAEANLRLRPFMMEVGEVSGVAPALWDELQVGSYIRDDGEIDNTYILHLATDGAELSDLINPFLAVYELNALPESRESYESSLLQWTIYSFDFNPPDFELRVDLAIAQQESRYYLVLLQSTVEENEALRTQVFFPALEYFGMPLAEIQAALGYEALTPVELEVFGIESAYPTGWQEANVGSYMRGADDFTTLIIQTSPDLSALEFAQLLLETLGLPPELPETGEAFETASLDWTIYQLDFNQGLDLSLMIALAEDEQQSYMVVLLTLAEEAESLRSTILLPVLDATQSLN